MNEARFSKGREVSGIVLLAMALFFGIAYYVPSASTGIIGEIFLGFGRGMLGVTAFVLPALFLYTALEYLISREARISKSRVSHVFILIVIIACLMHAFTIPSDEFKRVLLDVESNTATGAISLLWTSGRNLLPETITEGGLSGGVLPGLLTIGLQAIAGDTGALVLLIMAFALEMVLLFNVSFSKVLGKTGNVVKDAGQKVGTALSQTVHYATKKRQTDKSFDIPLEEDAWQEDQSYNAKPLDDFVETKKKTNKKDDVKEKAPIEPVYTEPIETNEPYTLDISTYKPKARETVEVPEEASDAGFFQVGGMDPHGKAYLSTDEKKKYQEKDASTDTGLDEKEAKNNYFDDIPIVSYDPEPEIKPLVIGSESKDEEEDPFAVPDFLKDVQYDRRKVDTNTGEILDEFLDEEEDKPSIRPSHIAPKEVAEEAGVKNRYGADIKTGPVKAVTAEDAIAMQHEEVEEKEYLLPSTTLLNLEDRANVKQNQDQIQGLGRKLEETLKSFGVDARVVNITTGPSITRFELTPGIGVKVSKITNLADDIALNLAAVGVRIEAPIPGKSAIGIEIPNKETSVVSLRSLIESRDFREAKSKLAVAIGRDIPGAPMLSDLARMPHLLIAGATGSGKSVCINSILVSLLYRAKPDEIKMLMIDPKVVELSVYNGIPHLLAPVVTDPKKAANTLNWAVVEMNRRYSLFAKKNVRDLLAYNKLAEREAFEKVPQMVIVIDELADLMMVAPNEVEDSIARLTAMARAAGMHLIIATQRPSVDVITGVIKANIPSRIAFMVSSQVDARTILDTSGAEKLLGKGDMLYAPQSSPKPIRGQGAFITEEEVERVVNFWKAQHDNQYDTKLQEEIVSAKPVGQSQENSDVQDQDELFPDAVDIIVDAGYASVSILQRRLNVGYPRAGKLIDSMEAAGYIGPFEGSKPRKLILTRPQWEQIKMGSDSTGEDEDEVED